MTNDFDIGRGASSGRIGEAGARVFMLGQREASDTVHVAGPDVEEYTEVKQIVDLTDVDLVVPEFRSTGHYSGTFQGPAGWRSLSGNELFRFNFDQAIDVAQNLVAGGFDFVRKGEMGFGNETYSPDATFCRTIPPGAALAQLEGLVVAQLYPPPHQHIYTVEWWMKFDADEHVTSNGISPEVFRYFSSGPDNGISIRLVGAAGVGAHSWTVQVTHWVGGASTSRTIAGYAITTSVPWQLFQIVFDKNQASPNKIKLYIDGVYVGNSAGALPEPGAVDNNSPIYYGSPLLVGSVDAIRMLNIANNSTRCLASYVECTTPAGTVEHVWLAQILIDGVVAVSRVIGKDESERAWWDFAAPVRHLTGPHEVAFRLVWHTV